jgi:hypothetical protein
VDKHGMSLPDSEPDHVGQHEGDEGCQHAFIDPQRVDPDGAVEQRDGHQQGWPSDAGMGAEVAVSEG